MTLILIKYWSLKKNHMAQKINLNTLSNKMMILDHYA